MTSPSSDEPDEPEEEGEQTEPGESEPSVRQAWRDANRSGPGWRAFKPTSPARPPRRVADAGGFASGLLLYTVAIIYVRYGPDGWKGWLSAKFLNKPIDAPKSGHRAVRKGGRSAI